MNILIIFALFAPNTASIRHHKTSGRIHRYTFIQFPTAVKEIAKWRAVGRCSCFRLRNRAVAIIRVRLAVVLASMNKPCYSKAIALFLLVIQSGQLSALINFRWFGEIIVTVVYESAFCVVRYRHGISIVLRLERYRSGYNTPPCFDS